RSYLIKDGKVRTHGTPQQIVHDPIAISEYLGTGFNDGSIIVGPASAVPMETEREFASGEVVRLVLEEEKIRRLIDGLKSENHAQAAADLLRRGPEAVPALIEALERRDVELRRRSF